ncbi:hypothetical protein [Thalassotalea marina]|uniref:Uncharacterized protein n=1 Tax=Thalassotalea marina TaxID=1673741 RepID=A0A919EGW2_9GAMM|nr:hypothetical protein [Thalassotalea marina]GHF78334.1 hypothetical protein GCM10017161_01730 [Thalassotalea marina]
MDSNTLSLSYTHQPLGIYLLKANFYCFLIIISFTWLTLTLFPMLDKPSVELSLSHLLERLVLAPLLYTCCLVIVFVALSYFVKQIYYLALITALFGAVSHIAIIPGYVGAIFALCFLLSLVYQYWDEHSRAHAVFVILMLNIFIHFVTFLLAI